MNCEQAQNLFEAHLDGELPANLETELAAHRIACEDCRRQLALLEVVEHVLVADLEESEPLCDDFTDRLMACLPPVAPSRWRRVLVLGVPLVAAAALAFILYGPFSPGGSSVVAGRWESGEPMVDGPDTGVNLGYDPQDEWQKMLDDIHAEWVRTRWGAGPLRSGIEDAAREWMKELTASPASVPRTGGPPAETPAATHDASLDRP